MKEAPILYRMAWVGSLAGFFAWLVEVMLPYLVSLPNEQQWKAELLDFAVVGLLIGALMAVVEPGRLPPFPVAGFCSASAAVAAWLVGYWIRLGWLGGRVEVGLVLTWLLMGVLLGAVVGLLRHGSSLLAVLPAATGGALGAALGSGAVVLLGEHIPYVTRVAGWMLAGTSICLVSTFVPVLTASGGLRFDSSPEAAVDLALQGRQWRIPAGDRVLFGNGGSEEPGGAYVDVPDPEMAPKHAWVHNRGSRFEVYPHRENMDVNGGPVWKTEAGNPPVDIGSGKPMSS